MDTWSRMFFAFVGAVITFGVFVGLWTWWSRRRLPADLGEPLRQVAGQWGATLADGGLRFLHRGVRGRLDFIAGKTEIQFMTGDRVVQVVEVVPVGFPLSLLGGGKVRARGSREEYDRIFRGPDDERVLLDVGAAYDLRMSPDGVIFRVHALPRSAAVLSSWIGCAFRVVELIDR
jgi:hypothetical protein